MKAGQQEPDPGIYGTALSEHAPHLEQRRPRTNEVRGPALR